MEVGPRYYSLQKEGAHGYDLIQTWGYLKPQLHKAQMSWLNRDNLKVYTLRESSRQCEVTKVESFNIPQD